MNVAVSYDPIALVLQAGPVGKTVLLVLLVFSVVSWAIIAERVRLFRSVRTGSDRFLGAFQQQRDMDQLNKRFLGSAAGLPVFRLFQDGYHRVQAKSFSVLTEAEWRTIEEAMSITVAEEVAGLERRLPFLATVGSVSPFLGLLGTVWGVMDAFARIGVAGTANLGNVAPGIAEALIATVAGLATAIPAVIAYNAFLRKIDTIRSQLERFAFEFLSRCRESARA